MLAHAAEHREAPRLEPIAIVGAGYVGLVTGASLAAEGRQVTLVETDVNRREVIASGRAPIFEPGLGALLRRVTDSGNLTVAADLAEVLVRTKMVVIAVGTPPLPDGRADLRALDSVVATIAAHAIAGTIAVIKSTVPPGTGRRVLEAMRRAGSGVEVVSCPEFLREGCALGDLADADRFVVGGSDDTAIARVVEALNPYHVPVMRTSSTAAELIKYGSNAFLAVKISFINEMANLCDLVGADIDEVAKGMGSDSRIGEASMRAGLGFGGSCFPKDVAALEHAARREGFSFWMLRSATEVNEQQRMRFVQKIRQAVGDQLESRRIALLGLAFKPGTDDLRHAPSIAIINRLTELGASVTVHDPVAMEEARGLITNVEFASDPYEAMSGADVVAVVTEWPQYLAIDWGHAATLVRQPVVVDGRNCLDSDLLARHGFNYHGMGRPRVTTRWGRRAADRVASGAAGVA